jgi:hypothetical protein
MMTQLRRGDRLLARLTLKGNFIWDRRDPDLYLDGEVFGTQAAGASNTDIRLPSGNGRRGGDLEMWFWLVPPPPAPTLTFPTATLTIVTQPTIATQPTFTATIVTQPTRTLPTATINPTIVTVTRTQPTLTRTLPTTVATILGPGGGPVPFGAEEASSPTVIVAPQPRRGARGRAENPFSGMRNVRTAQARKLIDAGIDGVAALAKAAPREVMAALGLRSQARARALIAEAQRLNEPT